MVSTARFAEIAAVAGDPARAAMLRALNDGRALTAGELARAADVAPQTASGHLARLTAAGLLTVEKQGRHRYHRLRSPAVAQMLESIMQVAGGDPPARRVVGPRDEALRAARTCYDHIAGRLGVALADAMVAAGHVELEGDGGLVTASGVAFLDRLGVDIEQRSKRRVFCRPCLDWSERRPHLAGRLGAALCTHCLAAGWVRQAKDGRALAVTPKGERAFREQFGVRLS